MPAERRTFTAARPVKTERTHEENQERLVIPAPALLFVFASSSAPMLMLNAVLILRPRAAVIAVSRLALSLPVELPRSTRSVLVVHCV